MVFLLMVIPTSLAKLALLDTIRNPDSYFLVLDDFKTRLYDNILPHISLIVVGIAVKLLFDYFTSQQRLSEMAKEKAEAELNFLKSQINPHFLFNSLNAVYFLIDKQNLRAREALHTFSDMLRYQLYEMNGEKTPVEKEIGYLKDYVYLQKLRKEENYKVEFDCQPEVKDFPIEPLLLIPFVENAFKHISHFPDKPNFVKLSLEKNNGHFHFQVENSKELIDKTTEQPGGIGLNNVKRRLELLYPGRHQVAIIDAGEKFTVDLKLKIGE
jgi:LytS/YehU family sensor histidine kinase